MAASHAFTPFSWLRVKRKLCSTSSVLVVASHAPVASVRASSSVHLALTARRLAAEAVSTMRLSSKPVSRTPAAFSTAPALVSASSARLDVASRSMSSSGSPALAHTRIDPTRVTGPTSGRTAPTPLMRTTD